MLAGASVYSLTRTNLTRTKNIAPLGLALAFASHFLLDAIPHFELVMPWQYALAAVAALFILLVARRSGVPFLFLGGIAGALPDAICASGISPAFIRLHTFFHFKPLFPVSVQLLYLELAFDLLLVLLFIGNELAIPLPAPQRKPPS